MMNLDEFDFGAGDSLVAWGLNQGNDEPVPMEVDYDSDMNANFKQLTNEIIQMLDDDSPKKLPKKLPKKSRVIRMYGFDTLCKLHPDEYKRLQGMGVGNVHIHKALVLESIKQYKLSSAHSSSSSAKSE